MSIRILSSGTTKKWPAPCRVMLLLCCAQLAVGCGDSEGASDGDASDSVKPIVIPAELQAEPAPERVAELVEIGRDSFTSKGCIACHMVTGEALTGPALGDIFGKSITLADGTQVDRDLAYLYKSIVVPNQYVSQSGQLRMPPYAYLDEQTLVGLSYFVRSLTALSPAAEEQSESGIDE